VSRLARRYWASLTDTDVESAELLIEYGRRRDATLWQRYVASLLDMPVTCGAATETKLTEGPASTPTLTIFYGVETTADVGTAPPTGRSWWRGAGFALATLLIVIAAFGVSRVLLSAPRVVAPATSVDPWYHTVKDPAGYVISLPWDWTRSVTQGKLAVVVTYTAPGGNGKLIVFEVNETSVTESSAQAQDIAEGSKDYQYLGRQTGAGWTEFSYRYYSKQYGTTQVVDHRFQTAEGKQYAIVASSPAGTDLTKQLTRAVNSFCLTGAHCS